MKTIRMLLATTLALSFTVPVFARGGGGFGGFHEGGGFGGEHSWGGHGFDHSFGSFGDFDRGFDRGAFTPSGGGYEHAGSFASNHPNLGADGGFGGAAGEGHVNNAHVNDFDSNRTNVQGSGNTFDHNTTVNNYNYGHNNVANGYHAEGYHADAYGYHPYGAYGYHGYGYGYHPYGYGAYGYHPYYGYHYGFYGYPGGWYAPGFMEASMWTFMGMSTMVDFLGIEALASSNKKTTTNVTYQGDNVYINGVPQSQYYAQAQQLAATANATTAAANATTAAANATAAAANLSAGSQLAQIMEQKLAGGAGASTSAATGVATGGGLGLGSATGGGAGAGLANTEAGNLNPADLAKLAQLANSSGGGLANLESLIKERGLAGAAGQEQGAAATANGVANLSALSSAAAPVEKWQPLGVYSLVEPGQKSSTTLFQLAINKDGIIKGNYMNQITNERSPLQGALDKKSGQISWYVGNNPTTIFETNFQEIAKKDSKVVVQFGAEQTQQMALIRLPKPSEKTGAGNNQSHEQNAATPSGS